MPAGTMTGCFLPNRKGGCLQQTHTMTPELANPQYGLLPKALLQRKSEFSSYNVLWQGQDREQGIHIAWVGVTPTQKFFIKHKNGSCSWHLYFHLCFLSCHAPFNLFPRCSGIKFAGDLVPEQCSDPDCSHACCFSSSGNSCATRHSMPIMWHWRIWEKGSAHQLQINYPQDKQLITFLGGSQWKQQ